jgi:hypothetical protein
MKPKRTSILPTVDLGGQMKKKQKLVPVYVHMEPNAVGETIVPVTGESITALLADWRVAQIQPLRTEEPRAGGPYPALLLLEEDAGEAGSGRLGFDL